MCGFYFILLEPLDPIHWDYVVFPVRSNPKLGMNLVLWDELALQEMTQEEVVIHRVCRDLRNRRGIELDEGIML